MSRPVTSDVIAGFKSSRRSSCAPVSCFLHCASREVILMQILRLISNFFYSSVLFHLLLKELLPSLASGVLNLENVLLLPDLITRKHLF